MAGKAILAQASILKRLFAFVIDILIIDVIVLFPFRGLMGRIIPDTGSFSKTFEFLSDSSSNSITLIVSITAAFAILYFVILEKKLGQSPGKMLFNLYVKSQTKDLKYWQLFVRSVFLIPFFPFILLWVIDPIVMFFHQRKPKVIGNIKQDKGC